MAKSHKKQLLTDLEDIASKANIKIRYEKTDARGGMCIHKGKSIIIIDKNATEDYKIKVIIDNLRRINLSEIYINPKIRDIIDNY